MEEMSEAEVRFEKASAIKSLLKQGTYYRDVDPDLFGEYEKAMDAEIRAFLRSRLDELLGVKPTKAQPQKAPDKNRSQPVVSAYPDLSKEIPDDSTEEEAETPVLEEGPRFGDVAIGYTALNTTSPEGNPMFVKNGVRFELVGMGDGGYMKALSSQTRPIGVNPIPAPNKHMAEAISAARAAQEANQARPSEDGGAMIDASILR